MTVSVDCFYLSESNDNSRDASLNVLDVQRIDLSLRSLLDRVDTAQLSLPIDRPTRKWEDRSGKTKYLPDLLYLTKGLVNYFEQGLLPATEVRESDIDYLLGAPPLARDIEAGRIVQRTVLKDTILPAIRDGLAEVDRESRGLLIIGRAGCGVSSILCSCAHILVTEKKHVVVVVDTQRSYGRAEWSAAGTLLGEIALATGTPAVVFVEAHGSSFDDISHLLRGAEEKRGRIFPILGGRRDVLKRRSSQETRRLFYDEISLGDRLNVAEWRSLSRILIQHGFSEGLSVDELSSRMSRVGRLLPAIYEATDRKNRKFREIIAFEYDGYGSDHLIQRAYRLICSLGALDVPVSQYWLLKALGDRGMSDAARILESLSEDIVVRRDQFSDAGDVEISPIHRIIAEEVVAYASPRPEDRLADLERLIGSANLASHKTGMAVAKLMYSRGALTSWIFANFSSRSEQDERIQRLFETAFSNAPLHPEVNVHLRQHAALLMRQFRHYDSAFEHLRVARDIDPDNPATDHITGLVHEKQALAAWAQFAKNQEPGHLAKAKAEEREALAFFRDLRDRRPCEEHGYESEARYYKRKREEIKERGFPSKIDEESQLQVFQGLSLLSAARKRVPRDKLLESGKTRALLKRLAGDLKAALDDLTEEIAASDDPVRIRQLMRSAAAVAAELQDWRACVRFCEQLLDEGERGADLFLVRDDAFKELGRSPRDRALAFKSSAEEFNRWDIESQVRWAELCLHQAHFKEAVYALKRANEVAEQQYSSQERNRVRGVIKENGRDVRYEGRVERMIGIHEGFCSLGEKRLQSLFFRVSPNLQGQIRIGSRIIFSIAWRVRGLKAISVQVKGDKQTEGDTKKKKKKKKA